MEKGFVESVYTDADDISFVRDAVMLHVDANTSDDVMDLVSERMINLGYALPGFDAALKNRERLYPTGLPGELCDIAVPHTDPEYIVKPFVTVVTTNKGVPFIEMGSEDTLLHPRIMFVLGFKKGAYQVKILQTIAELFVQRQEMPKRFLEATKVDDVWGLLEEIRRHVFEDD